MPNRLADATSPYLLQHADNPVDWYPWGDEAFAAAKSRAVPVLLSVGYAACHWCHVMAHESFEDEATAGLMNDRFVNVKVDREERPDVDAVYMDAVTAMTGHGGWPMTVFLTPEAEPFYAGTYFPPTARSGLPSFRDVLSAIAQAWQDKRDAVTEQGKAVVSRLESVRSSVAAPGQVPPSDDEVRSAVVVLMRQYDHAGGGFGQAPKFPPSMVCEFLLRHHARTGDSDALLVAEGTLRAMAGGGMYDQLAGGFARYSVDSSWTVPHFEKMLYDNALLARVYLHLWRTTGRPLGRRVALETCDFLLRELGTSEGGLASSLDADSEGEEGRFYVWTPDQLVEALGQDDGSWAAELFAVTESGTFEGGSSTLQLRREPDDRQRLDRVRATLLAARADRVRPARDDKVVAGWNGLAVAALAETGAMLGRPDLVAYAGQAAALVLRTHVVDGTLRRVSRDGVAGAPWAVLEDYADLAEGLLALFAVTGEVRWLDEAGLLLDTVLERFPDGAGGFFDTAHDAPSLVRRPRDPTDNVTPSGHAAAAGALLSYAALTGSGRHRDAAERALAVTAQLAAGSPRFAGWSLAVAESWLDGPRQVAVVAEPGPARDAMLRVALLGTAPGLVVATGSPGSRVPLLADRPVQDGRPTAYVCRGFVCDLPTTATDRLAEQVGASPVTVRE